MKIFNLFSLFSLTFCTNLVVQAESSSLNLRRSGQVEDLNEEVLFIANMSNFQDFDMISQDARSLGDNGLVATVFNSVTNFFLPILNDALKEILAENFDPLGLDIGDVIELGPLVPVLNDACEVKLDLNWALTLLSGLASLQIDTLEMLGGNNIISGRPLQKKKFKADFRLKTKMINNQNLYAGVGAGIDTLFCGFFLAQSVFGEAGINGADFNMKIRLKGEMGAFGDNPKLKSADVESVEMNYNSISVDIEDPELDGDAAARGDEVQQGKLRTAMGEEIALGLDALIADAVKPVVAEAYKRAISNILPLKLF